MRHGYSKELSSESIRNLMKQKQKEHEALVEKATKRVGRGVRGSEGRKFRKKTISDMSGMLACAPHNDVIVHDDVIKVEQNSYNITTAKKSPGPEFQLSETAL